MKQSKNWRAYARTAFNALRANRDNWGDPDCFRPISRLFYISVFDCAQVNHTGMISEEALKNPKERTHDHCNRPQFIGRMIMDNQDIYLDDLETFRKIFFYSCRTIIVTKKENDELSDLTANDEYGFRVFAPTHLKYKHLGIKLYQRPEGKVRWNKEDGNIIISPDFGICTFLGKFLSRIGRSYPCKLNSMAPS